MRILSITLAITIHLLLGMALLYTVVSPRGVVKGIEESLRIGVTR